MRACTNNSVKFKSRIPRYSATSIFYRFLFSIFFGFGMVKITSQLDLRPNDGPEFIDYLVSIAGSFFLIEINILADILMDKIFPIPKMIKVRIVLQIIVGVLFLYGLMTLLNSLERYHDYYEKPGMRIASMLGFFVIVMMAFGFVSARIFEEYLYMQSEVDVLKEEKLKNDYNALQDQLNPHYLFNNLSVLKSLILYDQKAAAKFTQNFTDVYRYVLQSKDKMTNSLSDELSFIDAYLGMHQERLGEGLVVKFDVEKHALQKSIPTLSLQLLIENAIKHNVASPANPLKIVIKANTETISVKNNVQPKENSYSTKTGLKNLISRYAMLTNDAVKIEKTDKVFKVVLPLL
jgi:two-component system, LytTR family, sensor kinase